MMTKSKIKYLGAILCSSASIDRETNNLTVFNIIEEINVLEKQLQSSPNNQTNKKVVPLQFELITLWKKEVLDQEVDIKSKIELVDPGNEILQTIEVPLVIKREHKRFRNRIQMNGLNITTKGEYNFRIYIKEDNEDKFNLVGEVPLTINVLKDEQLKNIKAVA